MIPSTFPEAAKTEQPCLRLAKDQQSYSIPARASRPIKGPDGVAVVC